MSYLPKIEPGISQATIREIIFCRSIADCRRLSSFRCASWQSILFCFYTGLRFCDVKDLTYGNVDYQNKILKYEQNKTCQFFLLIENKKLTKVISLTGNDLETSGLLYSAMFCTNQKNAFLIYKSSVFIPYYQSHSSEKWRNFNVKYKALPKHFLPKLNHKYVWHRFHLCCSQDS